MCRNPLGRSGPGRRRERRGAVADADRGWFFRAGANFPSIDTTARAEGKNGDIGTTIDFESQLGLEVSQTLPILDVAWRFSPRHRVEFNYLDLSRDATSTLTGSISWQGETYPVSTQVRSAFKSRVAALSYLTPLLSVGISSLYSVCPSSRSSGWLAPSS